jgi:hypothetical protein
MLGIGVSCIHSDKEPVLISLCRLLQCMENGKCMILDHGHPATDVYLCKYSPEEFKKCVVDFIRAGGA